MGAYVDRIPATDVADQPFDYTDERVAGLAATMSTTGFLSLPTLAWLDHHSTTADVIGRASC